MEINNTKVINDLALGKGLAANIDIEPGQLIIGIKEPSLIVVEKDALDEVCSYCFVGKQTASNLKRCSGCKVPRYCSTGCQKRDWKGIHQKECAILKGLPDLPPTPVRGLIQLLLRHQYGKAPDSKWAGLQSHLAEMKKSDRWNMTILQARAAISFSQSPMENLEMAITLFCIISANAFRVTLPDQTPIGFCFSPTLALVNHSCAPNAVIGFNGRNVTLKALSRIRENHQIFISYVDFTQGRAMRRAELQQRYFFSCECERCCRNETLYHAFLRQEEEGKVQGLWSMLYDRGNLRSRAERCVASLSPEVVEFAESAEPEVHRLLERSKFAEEQGERLVLLQQGLNLLAPITKLQLFVIPPLPNVFQELYLYHLDRESYLPALIILLFLMHTIDPYFHLQPDPQARITRLLAISLILKHLASLPTPELLSPLPSLSEDEAHLVRNIDYVSAFQALQIVVRELKLKEGVSLRSLEEELRDVEDVQKSRGNAGMELRRWMVQGDVAVEGKFMAEKLFEDLRNLAGLIGRVVEGIEE